MSHADDAAHVADDMTTTARTAATSAATSSAPSHSASSWAYDMASAKIRRTACHPGCATWPRPTLHLWSQWDHARP